MIRANVDRLLSSPGRELGRAARFLRFQLALWRFCARRLRENNVMAMSSALSFRTIFALIPLIVLAFLAAKSLGVLEDSKRSLRTFLDASGISQIVVSQGPDDAAAPPPDASDAAAAEINVADKIEEIVTRVEGQLTFQRLGPVGGALFIWTALSLLTTVEQSLNRIFGAPRSRALGRRLLLYWSAATLAPVGLALTTLAGQSAIRAVAEAPAIAWLVNIVGRAGPVLVGVLLLAAVYKLLPNTTVRLRAALGGAITATLLWLLAKWGFSSYVERYVVRGNLYGVLGVIPLFMLWLNLSWLIFLFGAELAHTAANLGRMQLAELAEHIVLGPADALAAVLAVAEPYAAGRGFATLDELAARLTLPETSVRWLLDHLIAAGLVSEVRSARDDAPHRRFFRFTLDEPEPRYALTRPPQRILVREVRDLLDPREATPPAADSVALARADAPRADDRNGRIAAAVARVQGQTRDALGALTLSDLLAPDSPQRPD